MLFLCCNLGLSQNDNTFLKRVENGELTFEECMSLRDSDRLLEIVPSLNRLKMEHETQEEYDGASYYEIITSLYVYYL